MAAQRKFNPGLFDLPQDIVRDLPFELVDRWAKSDQTPQTALEILEATKVRGTSVSSDSAGLTRLSQSKGLVEILALINRPKEIVHGYGKALGGRPVGVWAADNTQMFYPESIPTHDIAAMLLGVQERVTNECQIKIGLGAHHGEFYSIAGGLYGVEADAIEEVAENETEGGEIVISSTMKSNLPDGHGFTLHSRGDIHESEFSVFRLADGPRWHPSGELDHVYPIPYSQEFYRELCAVGRGEAPHLEVEQRYAKHKVVVLVERTHLESSSTQAALLDDLASSVLMRKLSLPMIKGGKEIKIAGTVAIFIFDDVKQAIPFALEYRAALRELGIESRLGIDRGPVLLFDLPTGGHDIAGMPVNIASKMAQDYGEFGKIYVTKSALDSAPQGFTPVTLVASGVSIDAYQN